VLEGPGDDAEGEDSPGEWRKEEEVDEPYREPEEPDASDLGPGVPEIPDPSENDVDPELSRRFWALVLVFNVALLALSLGAMFVVFEGNYELGGQLLLGGLAAFGFGLYRYRNTKARLGEDLEDTADSDSDGAESDNSTEQNG
jgi:hypothetical protein